MFKKTLLFLSFLISFQVLHFKNALAAKDDFSRPFAVFTEVALGYESGDSGYASADKKGYSSLMVGTYRLGIFSYYLGVGAEVDYSLLRQGGTQVDPILNKAHDVNLTPIETGFYAFAYIPWVNLRLGYSSLSAKMNINDIVNDQKDIEGETTKTYLSWFILPVMSIDYAIVERKFLAAENADITEDYEMEGSIISFTWAVAF